MSDLRSVLFVVSTVLGVCILSYYAFLRHDGVALGAVFGVMGVGGFAAFGPRG